MEQSFSFEQIILMIQLEIAIFSPNFRCNRDKALPIHKILKEYTDLMFTKFPQSKVDFFQKQAKCFSIIPKEP